MKAYAYRFIRKSFYSNSRSVQDPRNLGACLRSADGAGVNLVILPSDRSAGLTDVVRHVAAGAAESLPLMRARNLARIMREIKERGSFSWHQ